jgi:hypothetical protein
MKLRLILCSLRSRRPSLSRPRRKGKALAFRARVDGLLVGAIVVLGGLEVRLWRGPMEMASSGR